MILQAPYPLIQTTMLLPNQELGDTMSPNSDVLVTSSLDGTIYSYVRTASKVKKELSLQLTNEKAEELENFILEYSTEKWVLIDYNDEMWLVNLINDTVEFTTINRKYQAVRLQLEGEKIA